MDKLLALQPEEGKNYLKNMRVLILNADAIGLLRKDLICTLGTEQAKGFLIRYGYACGYSDAVNVMRDFPLEDKRDLYRLGAIFHTWVGMANVTPVEIRCNENERSWFFEGMWLNSYEAENHLKHFGPAGEPVCWSLVGYAGGFRSACFGERVIYKEVECAARGDPHCRFIGKTLAEWGDEILPDLHYYQETNLGEALERAHARIQAQNGILRQSAAIHEQLTRMVLNGEDMSAIAAVLGGIVGGAVYVENHFFRPVTCYIPEDAGHFAGEKPFSARELFAERRYRHFAGMLQNEKRPVFLPAELNNNRSARLIAPIVVGRDVLGYVCVHKSGGDFTELDQMTLERAATVFALKMMQARAVAEVENRLKGDFVNDLIKGSGDSESSFIERARYLGYDLNRPHQVLSIRIDGPARHAERPGRDEGRILHFKTQLCDSVNRALQAKNLTGLVSGSSEEVVVLAAINRDGNTGAAELARVIQEMINRQFNGEVTVSAGIGRLCNSPADFSLSYREAQRSLELIRVLEQKNAVLSYDQLGTYGLILQAVDKEALLAFMREQLGRLLEYDAQYGSELVKTLFLFFSHAEDLKEAARAASVSISGFKYRLRKICELGGFSLKDSNKKFDLNMALKIWQIAGCRT